MASLPRVQAFLLAQVDAHPTDLIQLAAREFQLTPQAVHKHLNLLILAGLLEKRGKTRGITYARAAPATRGLQRAGAHVSSSLPLARFETDRPSEIDPDRIWEDTFQNPLARFSPAVRDIARSVCAALLENARAFSGGSKITCFATQKEGKIAFCVTDNGVGIFRKLRDHYRFGGEREAILHLSKGGLTTDPEHGAGQGIARAAQNVGRFAVTSYALTYVNFSGHDWLVTQEGNWPGTRIDFEIALDVVAAPIPESVSSAASTRVEVQLALFPGEPYQSREQARRILHGLERFTKVVLDFQNVVSVGQSFVDEVFRVFRAEHPKIDIHYVHANPNVAFMIEWSIR